jgi:predicted trehalose synthase
MLMTTDSSPAEAFEALRREVALLRRALEGLAAEQKAQPDYSGVLAGIGARIREQNAALGAIAETPALQLTPEAMGQQILRASEQVRAEDARLLGHAQNGMTTVARQIEAAVGRAKTAQQQRRARIFAAIIGATFGIIIASVICMLINFISILQII